MSDEHVKTFEGVIETPLTINILRAVVTDEGEYVYDLLPFNDGDRVRVTVERIAVTDRPTRSGHSLEGTAVNGPIPVGQEGLSE